MIAEPIIKNNQNFYMREIIENTGKKESCKDENKESNRERILERKNVKIKTKNTSKEKKEELVNLKFFAIIIFIIGIVVGSISYRLLIEDPIIQEDIIDTFSKIPDENVKNDIIEKSLLGNIKILIIFWVAGISIVGTPLILILCFYKGFSTAFVIGAFLLKYGFIQGNIFVFKHIFPYYIFKILGIIILTASSLKVSLNVLKEKKDIRYEIIRHSLVTIISSLLFLISSLIEFKIMPTNL
ncbi:MAG: stage II sporulation protein M [Clostridia bacterium]|nr:stage II sporulation protein M [Clostridia bacterium]